MLAEANISISGGPALRARFIHPDPARGGRNPDPEPAAAAPVGLPTVPGRRAVPLTFNPIINDEANILAAITRGDRTLFDLAEEHGTTVANFAVWLQREDIQQKLNDLTSAGTTLTRVAAVNQLPKAVKAMAFQIEAHIFDRTHNLIKPGLDADRISALRDANARKACNLLLRLAKFDPAQPLYRASKLFPRADRGIDVRGDGGAVDDAALRPAPPKPTTEELLYAVINLPAFKPEFSLVVPEPDPHPLCVEALSDVRTASPKLHQQRDVLANRERVAEGAPVFPLTTARPEFSVNNTDANSALHNRGKIHPRDAQAPSHSRAGDLVPLIANALCRAPPCG